MVSMEDVTGNKSLYNNYSFYQNSTNSLTIPNPHVLPLTLTIELGVVSIGIVLNSLIVIVILFGSLLKTSVFMILLLVLAIADNATLFFHILWKIYNFLPFSESRCIFCIVRFMLYFSAAVSSWLIVLISSERYIAVFYPLKAHIYCTRKKTFFAILAVLIMISIFSLPTLLFSNIMKENIIYVCISVVSSSLLETLYIVLTTMMYSIIPFCIILVLNIQIVKKLVLRRRFRAQHQQQSSPAQTKMIMVMFSVCIVFIFTTLPNGVFHLLLFISKYKDSSFIHTDNLAVLMIKELWIVNHSVNFLLYCLTGSVFRQTFLHLIQCGKRHSSTRPSSAVQETVL